MNINDNVRVELSIVGGGGGGGGGFISPFCCKDCSKYSIKNMLGAAKNNYRGQETFNE